MEHKVIVLFQIYVSIVIWFVYDPLTIYLRLQNQIVCTYIDCLEKVYSH